MDFNGVNVTLEPGQRGLMPCDEALLAAQHDSVEMLSPDGVDALYAHPRPENTDGVQTQTEVTDEAAAKAPAIRGPQLKRRQPTMD
jgi:hypothetical protein